MKKASLFIILALLSGCGEKDENSAIMQELNETRKLFETKDLTTKLTNEGTEFVGDALELRDTCDEIMSYVGKGDIKGAFEEMKKYTFLPASEMDNAYRATQKQIDLTQNRFGAFQGYEFVYQQLVSESLVKFIYLAKCENHPLVWRFMFYKSGDTWTLNVFTWDDQIQAIN